MKRVFQDKRWAFHPLQPGLLWRRLVWLPWDKLTLKRALALTISIIPHRVRKQNIFAVTSVGVTIWAGWVIQFSTGINRWLGVKGTTYRINKIVASAPTKPLGNRKASRLVILVMIPNKYMFSVTSNHTVPHLNPATARVIIFSDYNSFVSNIRGSFNPHPLSC